MKEFTISKNDAGQRMDKFITKAVPKLPSSLLYKYIRLKRIKLNGKRCEISSKLALGDVVQCYINDEFFEAEEKRPEFMLAPAEIDVVYEDENILLCNKPAGLLVHEGDSWCADTLVARIQHYLYKKGDYDPKKENSFVPALCNRIDRNTCGIVIAAKNAASLRILNSKIKDREMEKKYLCIVKGTPKKQTGLLEHYIVKNEKTNTVEALKEPKPGCKEAKTKYTVISSHDGMSLCEAELLTGRTHQIRAQFGAIGHPLIGDVKYGKPKDGKGLMGQALCSYKLTFHLEEDCEHLSYLDGKTFTVKDAPFLHQLGFKIPKELL